MERSHREVLVVGRPLGTEVNPRALQSASVPMHAHTLEEPPALPQLFTEPAGERLLDSEAREGGKKKHARDMHAIQVVIPIEYFVGLKPKCVQHASHAPSVKRDQSDKNPDDSTWSRACQCQKGEENRDEHVPGGAKNARQAELTDKRFL
jgi:hypothetical protein